MANTEEHQVKEAFEAIHLPSDVAARAFAKIEAERARQESEAAEKSPAVQPDPCPSNLMQLKGERTKGRFAAQKNSHPNKCAGQESTTTEGPFAPQPSNSANEASAGQGSTTSQKRRRPLRLVKGGRIAAVAACVALVACLIGGVADFLRPVAYVGIDVNPSVELTLNRFGIVVGTCALNDDGQRALDEAPCMWRAFDDAARDLDGAMRAIAGEGAVVEVSIDCDNENRYATLAAQSDDCFGCNGEAHCDRTNAEERQAAHDSGMGVAKYRAYQALQEAGIDISAEECASMSMRELRDMLAKSGIDASEGEGEHAGTGNGQGKGAHNNNGTRGRDHGNGEHKCI